MKKGSKKNSKKKRIINIVKWIGGLILVSVLIAIVKVVINYLRGDL